VHPAHGVERVTGQDARQFRVAAAVRQPLQVVQEVRLRVRRQVDPGRLLVGQVLQERAERFQGAAGGAEGPRGEERVAARPLAGGLVQHQHAFGLLAGRQGGAEPRVPRADDHHVVPLAHAVPLQLDDLLLVQPGDRRSRGVRCACRSNAP
jgi:hypothetical protein